MKCQFHTCSHLEEDQMRRTVALPRFPGRGKKEVVLFVGVPGLKTHAVKGPGPPITDDTVALVRMCVPTPSPHRTVVTRVRFRDVSLFTS